MAMTMYKDIYMTDAYKTAFAGNEAFLVEGVSTPLAVAVYNKFKYRYPGYKDTEKFLDILKRNVDVNYPQYLQKKRIEPGELELDWMVQNYIEKQVQSQNVRSDTTQHGNDTHRTDVDMNKQPGYTETTYKDLKETTTHTGNGSVTKDGSETRTTTEGQHKVTDNYTEGTHTTDDVYYAGKTTQTTSPHVKTVTENGGDIVDYSGGAGVSATLPMSKTYDNVMMPEENENGDYETIHESPFGNVAAGFPSLEVHKSTSGKTSRHQLDWSTVSGQQQNYSKGYHKDTSTVTTSYEYGDGVTGDMVTNQGDKNNPDTRKNTRKGDSNNPDNRETIRQGLTDDVEKTTFDGYTETTNRDFTDENVKNGRIDVNYGVVMDYGNTTVTDSYGNVINSGSDSGLNREISTGRSLDAATLLSNATRYIEQSSAFQWFFRQLESCFAPWYDIDDNSNDDGNSFGGVIL